MAANGARMIRGDVGPPQPTTTDEEQRPTSKVRTVVAATAEPHRFSTVLHNAQ